MPQWYDIMTLLFCINSFAYMVICAKDAKTKHDNIHIKEKVDTNTLNEECITYSIEYLSSTIKLIKIKI